MTTAQDAWDIQQIVDGIDNAVDAKDWRLARSYFTEEIDVDFTSLAGGQPGRMPADQLIDAWRSNLFTAKRTFHLRGNHQITVTGDSGVVYSKAYAFNRVDRAHGDPLWEVWGSYVHHVERGPDGWLCTSMSFTVSHARGNDAVRAAAGE